MLIGLGHLLFVQLSAPRAPSDSAAAPASASTRQKLPTADQSSPWFIILNSPQDYSALWQKIARPDLVVIKADQLPINEAVDRSRGSRVASLRSLVEKVQVQGRIGEDFANLTVELVILVKGAEPTWAPIRLDGQRLTGAREGARELGLRRVEKAQWQVKLDGEGEHRIEVDLRSPVSVVSDRKSLALAIPEAASTAVELDFSGGESDIIIGANEVFGLNDKGDGKGTHLTAHLWPRSQLDLRWTSKADAGAQTPALLTAKGEIAIDIDLEQVRTRSSWVIRCIRGAPRSLVLRVDDLDQVTELELDDQSAEAGVERMPGSGKLTIRLADPLRSGDVKRLVMKTHRSFSNPGPRRNSFAGFPLTNAREQSGFIGITQSANLWVTAATSQGLRAVDAGRLPADLRTRPSTSLAFEFLDQPFLLDLEVEPSPPSVRADSRTIFRIGPDRAQSATSIDLDWVRGRLTELELGVAAGLQLVSVGPPDIVESWHLADLVSGRDSGGPHAEARRLRIRLTALGRDQNTVSLKLSGVERIPAEGKATLGLFAPLQATSVSASYALVADRNLTLELADDSGRIRRSNDAGLEADGPRSGWPWNFLRGELGLSPLLLVDDGNSRFLPINIARHARTIAQDSVLTAQVLRSWVDLLQRANLAVRYGALGSLEIRVPAVITDHWELLEKDLVEREELGREPDGARRYRLSFARPVVDKATLRFRYRLPLVPALDSKTLQEITIPWISFKDVAPGPARVEISLTPEIVVEQTGPTWVRSFEEARDEPTGEGNIISFVEGDPSSRGRPFTFKALALEPVPLPSFVAPRLLLKTAFSGDDSIRNSAWYWVESHGQDFPFALPDGARWLGARVDGRIAEHVDYDPSDSSYRLRFPAEVGSRPVVVELEYQVTGQPVSSPWQAPRLLDGGVVLQALWEVRLPLGFALLGVPRGWSDENQWYWSGYMWKRRAWKSAAGVNDWAKVGGASSRSLDDADLGNLDDTGRYLFSRAGQPIAMGVWIVPRPLLVAICSGTTLFVGFLAIFSKLRFRTIWLAIAALGLSAAVLLQPTALFLILESALLGVALTLLGLFIELMIERSRFLSIPVRGRALSATRASPDSSLNRPPTVGSDDSTAIRVRVPSTLDFIAAPIVGGEVVDEPRGSSLERS